MFRVEDVNGESIVVDGGWIEKLRGQQSKARAPATDYKDTEINELSRRRFLVFGEKEHLLQVIVDVGGSWMSLTVKEERRPEVEQLVAELERARDSTAA